MEKKYYPQVESLKDFCDAVEPEIRWAVDSIFPEEGIGFLAGPAGVGKSWMLLDLAIEMARGGCWLGQYQTSPGPVLLIDEESSRPLLRTRLERLLAAKKITTDALDIQLLVQKGVKLTDPEWLKRLEGYIYLTEPKLLIFDSLIRVLGCDENSSTEVAEVLRELRGFARRKQLLILLADHHRKPGLGTGPMNNRLRGSSDKVAAADAVLSLSQKGGCSIVEHSKARFAAPIDPFAIEIRDTGENAVEVLASVPSPGRSPKIRKARIFLENLLTSQWATRTQLLDAAAAEGVPRRHMVTALQTALKTGIVETKLDDQGVGGRGRRPSLYRLKKKPE